KRRKRLGQRLIFGNEIVGVSRDSFDYRRANESCNYDHYRNDHSQHREFVLQETAPRVTPQRSARHHLAANYFAYVLLGKGVFRSDVKIGRLGWRGGWSVIFQNAFAPGLESRLQAGIP